MAVALLVAGCPQEPTSSPRDLSGELPPAPTPASPADVVTGTPGGVAFWDFVKREPREPQRFAAHVPTGAASDFPLDAGNYARDYWGEGRAATHADFPQLGRGPFGHAIRMAQETSDG